MDDLFTLSCDPLGPTRVVALRGREAVSELYAFEIYALCEPGVTEKLADVVGAPASLRFNEQTADARQPFSGCVAEARVVDVNLGRFVVRPVFWRLSLGQHSRVWIDKRFPEVLEELLKQGGVTNYQLSLSGSYPQRKHICQYRESDFSFLSRWFEREGIHYYFEHGDDGETLHVSDAATSHERTLANPVRYYPVVDAAGHASLGEALHTFGARFAATTAEVRLKDYDYLRPALALESNAAVSPVGRDFVATFGGNLAEPAEAKRLATVRADERRGRIARFEAAGTVVGLRAGYVFELEDHPMSALNGEYLVTELGHAAVDRANLGPHASAIDARRQWLPGRDVPSYRVELGAMRASDPYQPVRRTPVPRAWGFERARVDGAADSDYAQIDDHGRYKVKILFDEQEVDPAKASAWVRMAQPHGGAPEGFHFPLRKDTEVRLAFVEGDPDLPIIAGVAPNPVTPSPVTKANATQNVVQTGAKNRIEIEDQAGDQYVAVFSPAEKTTLHLGAHAGPYQEGHNATLRTDGNAKVHAGGDRHITVGGEQTEDVTGLVKEDYHATQTTHVFGAWDETIDGGATQTISAGETRTVTGGVTEDISGGETRSITGDQTETVAANFDHTIGASESLVVGGNVDVTVGASRTDTIGASLSQTVASGITISVGGPITITAAAGASFTAPGGFNVLAPGGVTMVDDGHERKGANLFKSYWHYEGWYANVTWGSLVVNVGIYGIKAEALGVHIENQLCLSKTRDVLLKKGGSKVSTKGAAMWSYVAKMFN